VVAVTARADVEALHPEGIPDVGFTEFFRAEHKKLIRFVMTMGVGSDEAAEIAQVALVKAFQHWGAIGNPRAWVRRTAANELIGARQAARREVPQETMPEREVPISTALAVELSEEGRRVVAALATLPPRQREVMAWIIDGFSAAEIARELGVTPDSARQNYAKARKNLSRFYGRREKR
jgi:RNA polymerase sigma factor (sigma-70 family)